MGEDTNVLDKCALFSCNEKWNLMNEMSWSNCFNQ